MAARRRLDAELVRRGLVTSRTEAQEAVAAGLVTVSGNPVTKSASLVSADEALHMTAPPRRFVSRGGDKLQAALDRFGIDPTGRDCLDAGASTGGFTDCLLRAGARKVVAVDVGYGQLAWGLRTDPRVVVLERTNARSLDPADLSFAPELVVADLSFISLGAVLPALSRVAAAGADVVLLVKPQFEAGPDHVGRGGVVRDPLVWRRVLGEVADACRVNGIGVVAAIVSPLVGPAGNVEFLLYGCKGEPDGSVDLDAAVAEGERLRR
jgi:23S rRNA (cytidine1920-2'-O)/16S rRNA (cytidine1409-2'-O)-methyltransferase